MFPDLFPGKPSPGGYKKKNLPVRAFSILAYCLMPNHFHLLIRQNSEVPITKLLSKFAQAIPNISIKSMIA